MFAIVLAAGRGERMRPLTDHRPKPLLPVAGRPLIEHTVRRLVAAGIRDLVVNHARFGEQIEAALGTGRALGARIRYSPEGDAPLETGGGIVQALRQVEGECFIALNADVWTDYPLRQLLAAPRDLAHLVLVDNPEHNPEGDFGLSAGRVRSDGAEPRLTFSGLGVYRRALFADCRPGQFALTPLLRQAVAAGAVTGEHYTGDWVDVGTPERLRALEARLGARGSI